MANNRGDWISIVRAIVQRMAAADVTELEVHRGNVSLRLRRDPREGLRVAQRSDSPGTGVGEGPDLHQVVAPLTGVFYAASSPTAGAYVACGDWVEHDSLVGLIEAMKVFNEVTADCRGRVAAILVQQGQLVHAGAPILLVDTTAAPDHAGEVTE